jgi:hypothetical protein
MPSLIKVTLFKFWENKRRMVEERDGNDES